MTFKHTKFEDSPTMRSLEKVAVKHGLLTPEVRVKTAAVIPAADYFPSNNLMENVIKLCAGLREKGFEKHANELETKFLNYKRAFNAYETSKEKGEDLVDAAHPDGSHDLEGVDGDATIETIVDQHLKDMQVVDKKPTGKLVSAKDILSAVKVAIAQDSNIVKKNLDALKSNVSSIMRLYHSENVFGRPMTFAGGDLVDLLNSTDEKTLDLNKAKEVQQSLVDLKKVYSPGFIGFGGVAEDAWKKMVPYFNSAQYEANEIVKELTNPAPQGKPLPSPSDVGTNFTRTIYNAKNMIERTLDKIKNYKGNVKPGTKEQDIKDLQNMSARIDQVSDTFNNNIKNTSLDQNEVLQNAMQRINDITNSPGSSINDYFKAWS
jgi:hypothetical protein